MCWEFIVYFGKLLDMIIYLPQRKKKHKFIVVLINFAINQK